MRKKESVYEKCLIVELRKTGLQVESQKAITVHYDNEVEGEFVADLIVVDTVMLELKSIKRIIRANEVQLVNYLVVAEKPVRLLLNLWERKGKVKRKIKEINH